MWMLFYLAALCVWLVLRTAYRPDNSARAKMTRLIEAVPGFRGQYLLEDAYSRRIVALDPASERMAICTVGEKVRLVPFRDLVAAEIERDGVTIEKTARGSQAMGAAVGGALLGPAGLLVGGLSGKKTHTETVTRLALRLTVNDFDNPTIEIVFHDAKGLERMPPELPHKASPEQRLADWYGRFRVILHERDRGLAPRAPEAPIHVPGQSPIGFGRRRGLLAQG